ncbi:NUDIX domain-containing protein [Demetria terragena]|uniref:NUDIX domain-containing protein n=1 Tax=Demetria terragena TaxID=63959 RepID=UPI00035D7FAF|nr:NUDIX hydrolase [Demetria terragena]
MTEPLADRVESRPVRSHEVLHDGLVWSLVRDEVDLGDSIVTREYIEHPGAVGCVALDDQARVLLIQQYRHPGQILDWELPAGLLDVEGEAPWIAAQRELAEEADMAAGTWHVLADWQNSPGGSSENWRCFLARDLSAVETDYVREGEEAEIVVRWVSLDECVEAALAGRLHNACTVAGVLAAAAARDRNWATLRAHDTPWPEHPAYAR